MLWDDVRMLLVLLRAASLGEAGAKLGVDRSTVSRRIAALEEELGAQLFARTRDGIKPTAAALRLREHAERMEVEAAALSQAAAAGHEEATGLVRVATTEALATLLVSEGILDLRRRHPDLVVEIIAGNRPVDLARGEADMALRLTPLREAALRVRCVARVGIGLFASPGYLGARGHPRSVKALRGHDVLLPSGELTRMPEARWLAKQPGVRVAFRSNSMPALVEAAVAGLGLLPLGLGWGEGMPGLERVFALDDIPKRAIWLVTPAEGVTSGAARAVADGIAALFARKLGPPR
jgi:DNA-binding transcriptional LysR family regulator